MIILCRFQVWFPDSAYKTAQAIFDFNHEELPLIIFANWRGFSGGMKDMYEQVTLVLSKLCGKGGSMYCLIYCVFCNLVDLQVIKFGAMIVDALRQFTRPILIYLPPFSELRGGSWVVIDPSINRRYMEMYADPRSRGGVLEPEGVVSIKLRMKDQRAIMERLDEEMAQLAARAKQPGIQQ